LNDTIITIYCLCDDFLKAMHHFDDPQVQLSTAEVMSVPLLAATFFGGNIDKTCRFLHEYGYMPKMISKGRFNHRLHAVDPSIWQGLFSLLSEFFKRNNSEQTYVVDSLPVAVCENIRIRRCHLYPLEEHGQAFSEATSPASGATFMVCGCIWWLQGRASRLSSPWWRVQRPT
jgi:hypothetical protein